MHPATLFRLFACLAFSGALLYLTIERQNQITKLRFALPRLAKEIEELKEENMRLTYEIECFEHPSELMRRAHLAEYAHLKHPKSKEILTLRAGDPALFEKSVDLFETAISSKLSFATLWAHFVIVRDE